MEYKLKDGLLMFLIILVINATVLAFLLLKNGQNYDTNSNAGLASAELVKKIPEEQLLYVSNEVYFSAKGLESLIQFITLLFSIVISICLVNIRVLSKKIQKLEQQI